MGEGSVLCRMGSRHVGSELAGALDGTLVPTTSPSGRWRVYGTRSAPCAVWVCLVHGTLLLLLLLLLLRSGHRSVQRRIVRRHRQLAGRRSCRGLTGLGALPGPAHRRWRRDLGLTRWALTREQRGQRGLEGSVRVLRTDWG